MHNYWRARLGKRRVVAVSGHWSPAHDGHIELLKAAKLLGDFLLVVVNNDDQVKLKGSVPFLPADVRALIMSCLVMVDWVEISRSTDRSVCVDLERLRPTHFLNGGDVTEDNCRELETCRRLGIKTLFGVGGTKLNSSSTILRQVAAYQTAV